jgi:hypothetical protein
MLMHLVVGHKVTNLHLVGADPKVQSVVLVEFVFQREAANRTPQKNTLCKKLVPYLET